MTHPHGRTLTELERRAATISLRHAAVPASAIALWLDAQAYAPLDEHIATLAEWTKAFPDSRTGRLWYDSALGLDDALEWSRAGFAPHEAEKLTSLLLEHASHRDAEVLLNSERKWRDSGLPSKWIFMCVRYGIDDVRTASLMFNAFANSRSA